ncbi:MAG TPA: hypothetical protein VHV75_15725 [Solirubrobacteraceae bacterium]|nr:hypothetical protein [Solirubrobacteraceae bacterium]
MLVLASDWATISSLATAAGTLVLAIATFAAVRSSNRSARLAEVALQEQRRPILVPSRLDDPLQKLNFADGHWSHAEGGYATADHVAGNVYLAISLRNVGNGIGVCQGWAARAGQTMTSQAPNHISEDEFRMQTRDLYIPGNDIGMWQGALRNPDDPLRAALAESIDKGEPITVELLYSDLTGRQRAITRFGLLVREDKRLTAMSRAWFLDVEGPRPDTDELEQAISRIRDETGTPQPPAQTH